MLFGSYCWCQFPSDNVFSYFSRDSSQASKLLFSGKGKSLETQPKRVLAESRSTQSIPDIGGQVQKGNGNYGRDPVKGFIIVPCSSAAGVSIENIWNEWSDDQEDMGLDLQDIRKNITLQD